MKKLLAIAAFFIAANMTYAQIEVKVNPIGLLFGGVSVSGEYILNDNMGVEATIRFANRKYDGIASSDGDVRLTGFGIGGKYKYYFSPNRGADKFYANVYLRYAGSSSKYNDSFTTNEEKVTYTRVAAGFGVGYKIVAESGLVFDIGIGAGRALVNKLEDTGSTSVDNFINLDLTGIFAIGWRF